MARPAVPTRHRLTSQPFGRIALVGQPEARFDDVVCGVLLRDRKVLLVHRNSTRRWEPNTWDLPGGHVEAGESDLEAICRELGEELGIDADPTSARVIGRLVGRDYDLRMFVVGSWKGEPENHAPGEHDEMAWFGENDLSRLTLADPEVVAAVVQALREGFDSTGSTCRLGTPDDD